MAEPGRSGFQGVSVTVLSGGRGPAAEGASEETHFKGPLPWMHRYNRQAVLKARPSFY